MRWNCEAVIQQNRAAAVAPKCRRTSFCHVQRPQITPRPSTALTGHRGDGRVTGHADFGQSVGDPGIRAATLRGGSLV